jgi:hypothetical protein
MLVNGGFMNTSNIVLAIDAQIAQLQKVKSILTRTEPIEKRKPGRPGRASAHYKGASVEVIGRSKVAAAQKARLAKKRAVKKQADKSAPVPAKKTVMSKSVARKAIRIKKAGDGKKSAKPKVETAVTLAL